MSALAIITARGGSKRIPRKNIRPFLGKPILLYSIEAALQAGIFDEVMVSTDDPEIAELAKGAGASVPFLRSAQTANDYASTDDVIREVLAEADMAVEEIDAFILHQANSRIIDGVAKRLKAPKEKFPRNIEAYGNTCAASIPILLDEWNRSGRAKKGQRIVLSGFGAGLIWGAAYLEW